MVDAPYLSDDFERVARYIENNIQSFKVENLPDGKTEKIFTAYAPKDFLNSDGSKRLSIALSRVFDKHGKLMERSFYIEQDGNEKNRFLLVATKFEETGEVGVNFEGFPAKNELLQKIAEILGPVPG